MSPIFLVLLLPLASSIFIEGDRGFSSSSASSESHERSYGGGKRHHRRYDDDSRPHRPHRPPRPSRPQCEDGWMHFERPTGGWCMKVYPGSLTQPAAESMCQAQGATLSGLQNTAEINWVVSSALSVIAPTQTGGVWIGTQRRPECIGSGQTAQCTKTNTFVWTDNSATGIDGMIFQQGEPNNGNVPNGNQNCALLSVATTATFNAVSTYWSGQMDDIT
uniref:C-type lectin domain-containing protein n=1 Tax=Caenorhabditis tropicalis TaxID=1561998 RepID=A0A1I7UKM7_9PELO